MKPPVVTKPALDDIDREIIGRLSVDARLSNREIATALGVTEGTIRARLKRMHEAQLIRFTALTNLSRIGPMHIVFFRIRCELSRIRTLAQVIAAMDEIKCVIVTTGRHGILAMAPVNVFDLEVETLTTRIGALPGVMGLETSISIKAVKYNARVAKILPPTHDLGEDELDEDG